MGDLNCNVSKSPDAHINSVQFLSYAYQFEQLVNEPTRETTTSAALLDLIFTNRKENINEIIHLDTSDHSLIFAVRKFFTPKYCNTSQ